MTYAERVLSDRDVDVTGETRFDHYIPR